VEERTARRRVGEAYGRKEGVENGGVGMRFKRRKDDGNEEKLYRRRGSPFGKSKWVLADKGGEGKSFRGGTTQEKKKNKKGLQRGFAIRGGR